MKEWEGTRGSRSICVGVVEARKGVKKGGFRWSVGVEEPDPCAIVERGLLVAFFLGERRAKSEEGEERRRERGG